VILFLFSAFTAPDLITSIQENQKKIAWTLLEKAKDICAKQGVTPHLLQKCVNEIFNRQSWDLTVKHIFFLKSWEYDTSELTELP